VARVECGSKWTEDWTVNRSGPWKLDMWTGVPVDWSGMWTGIERGLKWTLNWNELWTRVD